MNKIQTIVQTSSTSKIPILYGLDSIHGASYVYGAALLPQSINIAATFNPDIAYTAGLITGKDTRAAAVPWIFAPVLGLGLQPLWARFPETFGEDPFLAAVMGASVIKGIQSEESAYTGIPSRAAACMKHFIGYSDPYNGHDRSPVNLADRVMRQLYLPSFQAAVDSGVLTAMESYQELGGIPMVSSSEYLNNLIRQEMEFEGMLVTDYKEIENLNLWHDVSSSIKSAVQLAMTETSIDMSMVPTDNSFATDLISLVQNGAVSMDRIDNSVRRILQLKDTLGLFSDPVPEVSDPLVATVGSEADYDSSLTAAQESITLLKNLNNALLPIPRDAKIMVGGPTCDSLVSQTGGWAFHWQGALNNAEFLSGTTILEGLREFSIDGETLV